MNKKKNLIKISLTLVILGIIVLLVSNFVDKKKINLYDVDFTNFEFEEGQVYTGEVEIIGDYFYTKTHHVTKHPDEHYYYYNAKLKNKYDDNIYVVKRLNTGGRINMIKSGEKTFKFTGVIKNNTSEMTDKQLSSLNKLININTAKVFNLSFNITTQTFLQLAGVALIATSIVLVVIVYPISNIYDKKRVEKK